MSDQRLAAALRSWPAWCSSKPTIVGTLNGGLTNQSYLIAADKARYVLRLNAPNSRQLGLNRALEIQVLQRASAAALTPAVAYSDPDCDFLVTEYRQGHCWTSEYAGVDNKVPALARLLKSIHELPPVHGNLDLRQRAMHYWLTIDKANMASNIPLRTIRALKKELQAVFEHAAALCVHPRLCHNDLLAENLLTTTDGQLLALDWEYAAMGDPFFDLAVIVEGHGMDAGCTLGLIQHYTNEPITKALRRLAFLRIIYCYMDLLWHMLQAGEQQGLTIKNKLQRLQKKLLSR